MDWFQRFAPLYRPRTAAIIENGLKIHDDRLEEGRNSMHELRRRLERLMIELDINAWAAPAAMGEAPEGLAATGAPAMNLPWTHAGLPIVSLPAGTGPNGMPLGLQFIGRFGQDEALVAMARAISGQASG
jgi:Asp-tRNA(Asn)/Glu-tRNA(Gln) amidotransferase A subunit family amidase